MKTTCGVWSLGVGLFFLTEVNTMAQGLVQREGAQLTLAGREYRAVGANVPGLFTDYSGIGFHIRETFGSVEAARQNSVTAILEAEKH